LNNRQPDLPAQCEGQTGRSDAANSIDDKFADATQFTPQPRSALTVQGNAKAGEKRERSGESPQCSVSRQELQRRHEQAECGSRTERGDASYDFKTPPSGIGRRAPIAHSQECALLPGQDVKQHPKVTFDQVWSPRDVLNATDGAHGLIAFEQHVSFQYGQAQSLTRITPNWRVL
jgi:hypothetical protein